MTRLPQCGQDGVALRARRRHALSPGIEAAAGDSDNATEGRDRKAGLVILHERESSLEAFGIVPVSFANQAAKLTNLSPDLSTVCSLGGADATP